MRQGTMSVLLGCHSIVHSYYVVKAWKVLYRKYPCFWELVCILLHDVGHGGLDYLDDFELKKKHWLKGSYKALSLFGMKGYLMVAGHCEYSGEPRSNLYKADKLSWKLAPRWWLVFNSIVEPKLKTGYKTRGEAVDAFRKAVETSIMSGAYRGTHHFFLERCKNEHNNTENQGQNPTEIRVKSHKEAIRRWNEAEETGHGIPLYLHGQYPPLRDYINADRPDGEKPTVPQGIEDNGIGQQHEDVRGLGQGSQGCSCAGALPPVEDLCARGQPTEEDQGQEVRQLQGK